MYALVVRSARTIRTYRIGSYQGALLDQVVAEGSVEYEYILVVFDSGDGDPFLFVTSERNSPDPALLAELGLDLSGYEKSDGSHFLCYFDADGHFNLGDSDGWGLVDVFEAEALRFLERRLGAKPQVHDGS
jgi:hypothetical protein